MRSANGDIEVWNVSHDYHQERVIAGGAEQSVEALVWRDGRLFTAGLYAQVTEWDLNTLAPKVSSV